MRMLLHVGGSGPDDPRGSDAMLYALDEGILKYAA